MKITVDVSGSSLSPVEEMFIFSTVGSVARSYDGRVTGISVEIKPPRASREPRYECKIEIDTDSGTLQHSARADSRGNAVVQAAEKVDRMLFELFRDESSTDRDDWTDLAA